MLSVTPKILLPSVWPSPLSLATTRGISVDYFSSAYLDVSVRRVPSVYLWIQYTVSYIAIWGVSPFGYPRIYRLFAPPRGFSQLVTSFFGSQCQGIPLVLFLAWTSSNDLLMFSTSIWSFVLAWVSQIGAYFRMLFYRSIVSVLPLFLERPFLSLG